MAMVQFINCQEKEEILGLQEKQLDGISMKKKEGHIQFIR